MSATVTSRIERYSPCVEALEWLNARRSPYHAWRACERGDWLLWIAARIGIDRRMLVLATCDCAELALVHVPEGETRPSEAIRVARAWVSGDESVSLEDVRSAFVAYAADAASAAAYAAASAAYAADAADAAYAASAASAAAYAASDAASAAYAAADAADASDAASAAYAADARRDTLAKCAALVRARIPWSEVKRAMKENGI
jgi:hypothetical protein